MVASTTRVWHRDAPNHTGNGKGASDIAIHFCLAKAGLTCSQPLDEHGHMLMSVMASTPQKTLRRHVGASRGNRQFCARWPCSERPGCWGAGTFAFHARPLKDPSMQWSLHSQLHQPTTTTRSGWKSGKLYQSLLPLPADQPMSRNGKQHASLVRIHVDQGAFSEGAYKEPTGAGSLPYG